MSRLLILIVCAAASVSAAARAGAAEIEHKAIGCVVADVFPRFDARITPADTVARARVFFRGEGSGWYSVQMTRAGDSFTAVLPKPKKSLPRFSYYVEAVDTALAANRTAEHTASVADAAAACAPDMRGPGTATTAVAILVEGPSGAAVIPAGFSATGVSAAAPAAVPGVATSTAGGGAASGGGGIGTTAVIAAGAGVAAVGAGAVVAASVLQDDFIQLRGTVMGRQVPIPGGGGTVVCEPPIAGAVVSTSLDSTTATTGADGRFNLVTQTRGNHCQVYTVTVTASGWPTYSGTGTFGSNSGSGSGLEFCFTPPRPMPFIFSDCP
jgi:hypothetical protein